MNDKVSTGTKVLDTLLNGGFEKGIITTLYGEAGSGKSNIMIISTMNSASYKKVAFVDTEGGFSVERASQISKDYKQILKNIIVVAPTSFEEQKKALEEIKTIVKHEKIALIAVDSIAMLYRLKRGSQEEISETNREMAEQLRTLSEIARKNDIPVVVTNQVYTSFKTGDVNMVGGDLLKYWSKCIIKLEKHNNAIRKATIIKHRSLPTNKSIYFEIVDSGLKEIKEPKKRFSLFN